MVDSGISDNVVFGQDIFMGNDILRVSIRNESPNGSPDCFVNEVQYRSGESWVTLLSGTSGQEFNSSVLCSNADTCKRIQNDNNLDEDFVKNWDEIVLTAENTFWKAKERLTFENASGIWKRKQNFYLKGNPGISISPGFSVSQPDSFRYTYPLQVYDQQLLTVPALRCDPAWAVPIPCHILSNSEIVLIYGVDRNAGKGTLDLQPTFQGQSVRLGITCPDAAGDDIGREIEITEFIAIARLQHGDIPLLVAEKLAAQILLNKPVPKLNRVEAADRVAEFLLHGGLWEPDVFSIGSGWYRNMWVYTTGEKPEKNPYFDLGWGEGYGVLIMQALAGNWSRTGNVQMKTLLEEMTRNIIHFRRDAKEPGAYYDRFNRIGTISLLGASVEGGTDFVGFKRIWSHSLGNIGYQLLDLYRSMSDFPTNDVRQMWLGIGLEIGEFFAMHQKENGDIQDGFDEENREINHKKHRIPARAIVCGLWTLISNITGDFSYLERARRLANMLSGEISSFAFYNQMCDTHTKFHEGKPNPEIADKEPEIWDGENASYALLGLTELYLATSDVKMEQLCKLSAAYLISWIYFYDVPNGFHGRTRGGTTCRMPDYPLLYVGAGALAYISLVRLADRTGEHFYHQMADEIVECIMVYQWNSPDKLWHGGIVHALDQRDGSHWGPAKLGQVDSGMTSGMSLAILEYWIRTDRGDIKKEVHR